MSTQKIDLARLSANFASWQSCKKHNNKTWEDKWEEDINKQLEHLPHGSGLDAGVTFNWTDSTPEKLIFRFSYHHIKNDYYDGWTNHTLIITPSFYHQFHLKITGRDRNQVKDYLHNLFREVF